MSVLRQSGTNIFLELQRGHGRRLQHVQQSCQCICNTWPACSTLALANMLHCYAAAAMQRQLPLLQCITYSTLLNYFTKQSWPQQLIISCQSAKAGLDRRIHTTKKKQDLQHNLSCLEVTNQSKPTCMANPCCGPVLRSSPEPQRKPCGSCVAAQQFRRDTSIWRCLTCRLRS